MSTNVYRRPIGFEWDEEKRRVEGRGTRNLRRYGRAARLGRAPTGKTSVHLRVDSDVLEWFRKQGRGHLSRMNAVLRSLWLRTPCQFRVRRPCGGVAAVERYRVYPYLTLVYP